MKPASSAIDQMERLPKRGSVRRRRGSSQTPRKHEFREGRSFCLQKPTDVPGLDAVTSGIARPAFLGQPPHAKQGLGEYSYARARAWQTGQNDAICRFQLRHRYRIRPTRRDVRSSNRTAPCEPANVGRRPLLAPGPCTSVPVRAERTKCGTTRNRGSLGP